jgi:hypothetical protein
VSRAWSPEHEDDEDAYWAARREREQDSPHTLERWFRRRIASILRNGHPIPIWRKAREQVAVDWFCARRSAFLNWQDSPSFAGEGFASGQWVIDEAAVRAAHTLALRGEDVAAQVDLLLWELDQPASWFARVIPTEPASCELMGPTPGRSTAVAESQRRLERLRDRWPRACDKCREVFVPTQRNKARKVTTCDHCSGRAARQAKQTERKAAQ